MSAGLIGAFVGLVIAIADSRCCACSPAASSLRRNGPHHHGHEPAGAPAHRGLLRRPDSVCRRIHVGPAQAAKSLLLKEFVGAFFLSMR
jgi:hypothetical protein